VTFRNNRRPKAHAMTSPTTLQDFEAIELQGEETTIFLRRSGSGPAVLLLHGFPQTHLMWRSVAPLLAPPFTAIWSPPPCYVPALLPTMRPMRSGPWRETWFVSWRNSDSGASQSPGMIGAVVPRIVLRSITRSEWKVSLSLTFFRPQTPGSGPTRGWPRLSGR